MGGKFTEREVLECSALFGHGSVKRLKNNRHKVVTFGALDLFEGLNVFIFGAVHDREDFGDEMRFIS